MGKKWRPHELERLVSGIEAGESFDEIGCDVERSSRAVRARAGRLRTCPAMHCPRYREEHNMGDDGCLYGEDGAEHGI